MAITMGNAIKNRASNEEILAILKELPNPNQDDDDGQFFLDWFSPTGCTGQPKKTNPNEHQRGVAKLAPGDGFQQALSLFPFFPSFR